MKKIFADRCYVHRDIRRDYHTSLLKKLDSYYVQLDALASRSTVEREKSANTHCTLSKITKRFKRLVKGVEQDVAQPDALTKECQGLVKAYQQEIDFLTCQCCAINVRFSGIMVWRCTRRQAVRRWVLPWSTDAQPRTSTSIKQPMMTTTTQGVNYQCRAGRTLTLES